MHQQRLTHRLAPVLLIVIMAIAAGLRFYNLNWDNGIFAHPDERSTVAFYAPTIHWPEDPAKILNPRASTLNPFWDVNHQTRRSYTYGHFPLYTLVFVANVCNDLAQYTDSLPFDLPPEWKQFLSSSLTPHGFARIGRGLMALADLLSVYLIFLLGRRLYGVWAGLLAAALSTFTVLQVQLAHFFAVDPVSTTFTLLAIYGAILLYDCQSIGAALVTGLGIGLAVASKFSALPIAFAPVVAGYLIICHQQKMAGKSEFPTSALSSALSSRVLILVIMALFVAFVVFAVTSPFVLLDFENFKRAVIDEQGNMVSGVADFPFTRQYRQTWPYIYFIWQQLRWGMGWPLGLLAFAGLGWVIGKAVRGKAHPGEWIILWWIILYFGPTGLFLAKFMRYMIPVVPLFILFGAGLVVALWQYKTSKDNQKSSANGQIINETLPPSFSGSPWPEKLTKIAAVILTVLALGGAIFWALAFVNGVYGTEHTWVTFARWVYANVPDGSCIAWEHWDDRMPTDIPEPGGNPGAHGYFQPQLPMYDEDSPQKYAFLRQTLLDCDYLVLASNRLYRTIPRLPERYPMSTRYYQALFSGELGFTKIYSVETPPRLGPVVFDDQAADESFTVYDHPKPILFQKTRQLSAPEWDAILGDTWAGAKPGYVGPPTLLTRLRSIGKNSPAPYQPEEKDEGKSLLLTTPVDQLPVVDDYNWNTPANNSTFLAVSIWWLAVILIGFMTFPLTFFFFHKLPDRGYALSKSFGLLLVSYFVWLNSSLGWLGNTRATAMLAVIILLGFALWVAIKWRQKIAQFWRQERWLILVTEIIFLLVYLFFVRLRVLNPDLWQPWQGGEKMLEIGFLNAVVKSATMPPYDPFFAGGVMNYYYYGLFLVGLLIKLTGIRPEIAFNLAVPMLAGLTASNVFSLAGNLSNRGMANGKSQSLSARYVIAGLLGILFVVFLGNLEGAAQFLRELGQLGTSDFRSAIPGLETVARAVSGIPPLIGGERLPAYNYWDPTRVIPETINEFPYFSFIFADLHPHMIGLPFTALFLSLVYHWLRPARPPVTVSASQPADEIAGQPENGPLASNSLLSTLLRWLALPFVLGAVAVINTWDLPTYLGLMAAAFLLNDYRCLERPLTMQKSGLLLLKSGIFAGALFTVTYLLYLPFFLNYQAIDVGLGLVHTKTPLDQHLKIWGFFLFILVTWLWVSLLYPVSRNSLLRVMSLALRRWRVWPHLYEIYRRVVKRQTDACRVGLLSLAGMFVIALALFLLGYGVPAYLVPLVALALLLLFRPEASGEIASLNLLAFTGLLVLLGMEFFFLRDWLGGGDYYRMNTLFKFYIQVWLIFGVVAAVTLPQLWAWSGRWSWPGQLAWQDAVLLLLLATLVYPALGTRTRVNDRFPGDDNRPPIGTLDGLAYMTVGTFEWPAGKLIELKYDYEAIRWLQANVFGTPIIAEAKVGYYREGGMRVAAYTGLPSVLGGLHQNEQRYARQVGERDFMINQFWTTPDPRRTLELIDELNITYVYLGQLERITYGDHVAVEFEQLATQGELALVFENEKTKIYKRVK
ncbi:MAG: glycosyltransferase family 39 protein [Anaerolineae bacterium]|nr:glycosyltransferase family 39 protein [Anaerolineae bacterium]